MNTTHKIKFVRNVIRLVPLVPINPYVQAVPHNKF